MRLRNRPALRYGLLVVILDLDGVAAGLAEVNGAREMRGLRARHALQSVALLVRFEIAPGGVDLLEARDPQSIMVVVRFVGRVLSTLVHHQVPGGVRVAQDRLAVAALDDFHRAELGKHRQRLVELPAFVVAVGQADRLQHA